MDRFQKAISCLNKSQRYVLACSFGPDSMCLFDLLYKNSIDFVVAHVNYHARLESNQETKDLRDYCDKRHIPFFLKDVKYQKRYGNFQSWAREKRYLFFKEVCQVVGTSNVLIAHQEDDVIETFFIQKQRNAEVFSYGILTNSIVLDTNIIRPLLELTKTDIEQYCVENRVPFSLDSSNLEKKYTRNKLRIEVVAKLSKEERKKIIAEIDNLNAELVERKEELEKMYSPFNMIDVEELKQLNKHDLYFVVYRMVTKAIPPRKFTPQLYKIINRLIFSMKPNGQHKLSATISVVKEYGTLYIANLKKIKSYSIQVRSPQVVNTDYFKIELEKEMPHRNISSSDWPIVIRSAKPNDKYQIADYEVTVRRLFIDWKVPTIMRQVWPIIVNKDGKILYIPRYRENYDTTQTTDFIVYFPHIEK